MRQVIPLNPWQKLPWRPINRLAFRYQMCRRLSHTSTSTHAPHLNFQAIDAKWQQRWAGAAPQTQPADASSKGKFYVLPMFPYPSGTLHIGHLRVYTISDVIARYKQMQGYDVIHPIGWDAFGLPAENAAIERGINPTDWTLQNISIMKDQLIAMGGRWDWDREFKTCDPSFYKHTQRIFLMLHERGLAYQAESLVNYDPVDGTVLANEQVDANGCSWRSGAKVEKIRLRQWFLRIKDFQEALLEDMEQFSKNNRWPERVLSMQRNWLGRSKGVRLPFEIESDPGMPQFDPVELFTTRADTVFGAQYIALSLRHPIVLELAKNDPDLQAFIDSAPSFEPESKNGYLLPGIQAINPLSSFSGPFTKVDDPLPIYAAPYVLEDYGSGAVMGVPGHDSRDHEFWRENQGREAILTVVAPSDSMVPVSSYLLPGEGDVPFTQKGVLTMASGPFCGLSSEDAIEQIIQKLQQHGIGAKYAENWRLRDWLISRQRYWGTPIPIIHCDSCGAVPVPTSELPVELPKLSSSQLKGKGGNPLENIPEWVNTTCPKCHSSAKRETDTMDTFMDSSWYFFRFADPKNVEMPMSPAKADSNIPIDVYIGGIEHAILHLLYSRFISKFLATTSLWPSGGGPSNRGEPFKQLITQGMVHGKTYSDPLTGRFLRPDEVDTSDISSPRIIKTGETPNISFEKMSKSKYNGVDPSTCIAKYGADTTRAHMLFQAPVTEVLEWDEDRIVGIQRWFNRIWRVSAPITRSDGSKTTLETTIKAQDLNEDDADIWLVVQKTIESVNIALDETFSLNTVISDLTKLTNALEDARLDKSISIPILYQAISSLLRMLAPVAPAFAEECWERVHQNLDKSVSSIFSNEFPSPDHDCISALTDRVQVCAVQINGKVKFAVKIPVPSAETLKAKPDVLKDWVLARILETNEGQLWFGGQIDGVGNEKAKISLKNDVQKIIVVKGGRTVNMVVQKKSVSKNGQH